MQTVLPRMLLLRQIIWNHHPRIQSFHHFSEILDMQINLVLVCVIYSNTANIILVKIRNLLKETFLES